MHTSNPATDRHRKTGHQTATLRTEPTIAVLSTRVVLEGDDALEEALQATFDVDAGGDVVLVRPVRDARTVIFRKVPGAIREERRTQGVPK